MRLTHTERSQADPERALRGLILDAALAELTAKDVAAFRIEGVAARAGVDLQTVRNRWANSSELYVAALMDWGLRHAPVPDTGSLRGDWMEYSRSLVRILDSPTGRRVVGALIVSRSDWDVSGFREAFQSARTARLSVMVRRAIDRGECASDVDPPLLTELLSAGLVIPLVFYGRALSEEYAERVIDALLEGARK